jgi:XTP/dITP diphosphohydrolase
MKILAATNNKHKIGEFKSILADAGFQLVAPDELGREIPDIPEDGATFEENSGIKALGFAKLAEMTVIADDSGLEIRALDNAPGIYSARYAETNEKRIERVLRELEEKCQSVKVSECQSGNIKTNIEHSIRHGGNVERRSEIGNAVADDPSSLGNSAVAGRRPATDDWKLAACGCSDRSARFVCVIALAEPGKVIATFRGEVYGKIAFEARGCGGFGYDPIFIPNGYDKSFAELGSEIKDRISHRANALKKLEKYLKGEKTL